MKTQHTTGPWYVAAIDSKAGRIVGDETAGGWDKIQVIGANATVATVYRSRDARAICDAVNNWAEVVAVVEELADLCPRMSDDDPIAPAVREALDKAKKIIRRARGEEG